MSIWCKIFGHKPPAYSRVIGGEYMKVSLTEVDGIGRQHAHVNAECSRCGENFLVGKIHVPKRTK